MFQSPCRQDPPPLRITLNQPAHVAPKHEPNHRPSRFLNLRPASGSLCQPMGSRDAQRTPQLIAGRVYHQRGLFTCGKNIPNLHVRLINPGSTLVGQQSFGPRIRLISSAPKSKQATHPPTNRSWKTKCIFEKHRALHTDIFVGGRATEHPVGCVLFDGTMFGLCKRETKGKLSSLSVNPASHRIN